MSKKKKPKYLSGKNEIAIFNLLPGAIQLESHSKAVSFWKSAKRCGRSAKIRENKVILLDEQDKVNYFIA